MSLPTHLTIATRKSPLALWQAEYAKAKLMHHWPELTVLLLPMKTSGDKFLNTKLLDIGGKGLFVKELEEALLDKRADIAVHSMKDVPAVLPEGLTLSTMFARENPFDAFVSEAYPSLEALPQGACLGTSSLRRQAQALMMRPDLKIKPIRGNVGTRLQKLASGEYDGILLAAAGLERLGLEDKITEVLPDSHFLPAPGQGALGIETRRDDADIQALLAPLHDGISASTVEAERRVNHALGGSCHTPIALFCRPIGPDDFQLDALISKTDGSAVIRDQQQGRVPLELAEACIASLEQKGIKEFLNEI